MSLSILFKGRDLTGAVQAHRTDNSERSLRFTEEELQTKTDAIFNSYYQGGWFQESKKKAIRSTLKGLVREERTMKLALLVSNEVAMLPAGRLSPANRRKHINIRIAAIKSNPEFNGLTDTDIKFALFNLKRLSSVLRKNGIINSKGTMEQAAPKIDRKFAKSFIGEFDEWNHDVDLILNSPREVKISKFSKLRNMLALDIESKSVSWETKDRAMNIFIDLDIILVNGIQNEICNYFSKLELQYINSILNECNAKIDMSLLQKLKYMRKFECGELNKYHRTLIQILINLLDTENTNFIQELKALITLQRENPKVFERFSPDQRIFLNLIAEIPIELKQSSCSQTMAEINSRSYGSLKRDRFQPVETQSIPLPDSGRLCLNSHHLRTQ